MNANKDNKDATTFDDLQSSNNYCTNGDDTQSTGSSSTHGTNDANEANDPTLAPGEKMVRMLTGRPSSQRLRHEKAIKFPVKLMYVLECGDYLDVISWSHDGLSFMILDTTDFEEKVLPDIFKEAKFTSFQRKLYRWGFVKRVKSKYSYYTHANFQKGNFALCRMMDCTRCTRRLSASPQHTSLSSLCTESMAASGMAPCRHWGGLWADDPLHQIRLMTHTQNSNAMTGTLPRTNALRGSNNDLLSNTSMSGINQYPSSLQKDVNQLRIMNQVNTISQSKQQQILQDAFSVLQRAYELDNQNELRRQSF